MDEKEWSKLLKTYRSPIRVAKESLEGLSDHINTKCKTGQTQMVATQSAGRRGLPPFHEELVVCNRGTKGCSLNHDDKTALRFSEMAFERIVELEKK